MTAPPTPAPPAPTSPPPLTSAGRSALRAVVVIAASAVVLGCVVTLGIAAWGITTLRVSVETENLPDGMRSLTVDAADATVRVKVDPQATASTVEWRTLTSTRDGGQRLEVTSDAAGTRLLLTPESPSVVGWGRSGELIVTVPPRLARTPISGIQSFRAEAADGNIDIAFAAAPRRIEAVSRDGDIHIALPAPGPYLLWAHSEGSTSIRVPETTDPARAVSEVTVRSDDGDVAVDTRGRG